MLKFFHSLFQEYDSEKPQTNNNEDLAVAVCTLLLEAAHSDMTFSNDEEDHIAKLMKNHFSLDEKNYTKIKEQATRAQKESVGLYGFTKVVRKQYSHEERRKVLTMLWEIVLTDNKIDPYEEQLMRNIYDIIGLEHQDYIETKLKAMNTKK